MEFRLFFAALALGLLCSSYAQPTIGAAPVGSNGAVAGAAQAPPTDDDILSLYDAKMATAMSELSKLSYCGPDIRVSGIGSCTPCKEAGFEITPGRLQTLSFSSGGVENANFMLVGKFTGLLNRSGDVLNTSRAGQAFPPASGCFVSIRGAEDGAASEHEVGLKALVPAGLASCPSCQVHQGFLGVWKAASKKLEATLGANGCGPGGEGIYVTGHGMGGAVAAIVIAQLTNLGYNVLLSYLIEPMRPGNVVFAQWFWAAVQKNHPPVAVFTETNGQDKVPRFPSRSDGYSSLPYEIYRRPPSTEIHLCKSTTESSCITSNVKRGWWYDNSPWLDHVFASYFPQQYILPLPMECGQDVNPIEAQFMWMGVGLKAHVVSLGPDAAGVIFWTSLLGGLCCFCGCCYCVCLAVGCHKPDHHLGHKRIHMAPGYDYDNYGMGCMRNNGPQVYHEGANPLSFICCSNGSGPLGHAPYSGHGVNTAFGGSGAYHAYNNQPFASTYVSSSNPYR